MIGIDIININRFKKLINAKSKEHLLKRIFTEKEMKQIESNNEEFKIEALAGRYAVKEAVIKASNGELVLSNLKNIETGQDIFGTITAHVSNIKVRWDTYDVSLSYGGEYAIGIAIKKSIDK